MISYDDLKIGLKIKRLREIRGFSRKEMASLLNISDRSYADLENEIGNITLKRLVEIANIFNCELSDILEFNYKNFLQFNVPNNKGTNINHNQIEKNYVNEMELIKKFEKAKDDIIIIKKRKLVSSEMKFLY